MGRSAPPHRFIAPQGASNDSNRVGRLKLSVVRRNRAGHDYVSLEEWERCLKIVSYCVLRIGPALAPVLERVEREVERARRDDPMARARNHLEAFAADLGVKPKSL